MYSRHNKNTAWNELSAGCCVHTPVNIVFIIIFFCIASEVGKKNKQKTFQTGGGTHWFNGRCSTVEPDDDSGVTET